jgi:lipopolysaccharide/colanic/teichoic acid biosynthesis glycosyltransferase
MTARRKVALRAKRFLDVVGAVAALLALLPVLAATAIAILATDGRPVLFRQVRPGLGGRPFTILKFRTMRATRPGEVFYQTDEARLTRLGRFLRSTSIDELPELWNVLRGDMSLVGPRPLLVEYLDKYTPEEARRHEVRPGITGWAAVHGRHTARFAERLKLDVWYVDHWSLWLDLRILALTAVQLVRRSDVAATQDLAAVGFPLPGVEARRPGDAERVRKAAGDADAP